MTEEGGTWQHWKCWKRSGNQLPHLMNGSQNSILRTRWILWLGVMYDTLLVYKRQARKASPSISNGPCAEHNGLVEGGLMTDRPPVDRLPWAQMEEQHRIKLELGHAGGRKRPWREILESTGRPMKLSEQLPKGVGSALPPTFYHLFLFHILTSLVPPYQVALTIELRLWVSSCLPSDLFHSIRVLNNFTPWMLQCKVRDITNTWNHVSFSLELQIHLKLHLSMQMQNFQLCHLPEKKLLLPWKIQKMARH